MRGVSASPHHQLLLPGSETVLQTRLPTVSASRPPPFPQPHGTPARPPPCQVGPASALPPALRAAGPVSSENSAGCASPGRAEPSQPGQHWWGGRDPPATPIAILCPGNLCWAAQSGCGTRPWADWGVRCCGRGTGAGFTEACIGDRELIFKRKQCFREPGTGGVLPQPKGRVCVGLGFLKQRGGMAGC